MPSSRLFWPMLIGLLGALAGMALSSPLTDASVPSPSSVPDVNGGGAIISPDPRWLDLIHARETAGVRLQAAAPSLHVHLTDRTVAGRVSSPAPVSVRVTRGENQIAVATATPLPDSGSYFYVASLTWNPYPGGCGGLCSCGALEPGDVVWMAQGGTALSLTIPPLTAQADGTGGAVFGAAPPSDTLALYLYPRRDPTAVLTRTVAAGPDGRYQTDWDDVRPGDTGYAVWNADPDRAAYVRFVAPLLQVQVDGWEIAGMAAPCSGIWITVTDAEGNFRANRWASADAGGQFFAWPGESDKWPSPAHSPGDRIEASAAGQVFSTVVLPVTAQADRAGGEVRGAAPVGVPVWVELFHGPLDSGYEPLRQRWPWASLTATATAEGRYTAPVSLAPADFGAAFAPGPDGHETYARFAVPYLQVTLGPERPRQYRIQGQVDGTNVPVTITLQGPGGLVRDVRILRSAGNGFLQDLGGESDPVLEAGDVLTVETPRGTQAALTLPTLTGQVNLLLDTVSGQAPPGARVTVSIWGEYGYPLPPDPWAAGGGGGTPPPPPTWATRVVTAGADGTYFADFRGIVDLTRRSVGEVSITTPEGHTLLRFLRARDCRLALASVWVGGNYLRVLSGVGCPSATVRLLDPAGEVKARAEADFSWLDSASFYFYQPGACPWPDWCGDTSHPIFILPGDRVELISGSSIYTTTVPKLTLALDRGTPALSGQAPAGETLQGAIRDESSVHFAFTATVTPQGFYTVPLTGIYTPTAGDRISIWWTSGETNFLAYDVLPRLEATLFGTYLYGYLHPLVAYEISTPSGSFPGRAGPGGTFWAYVPRLLPGDVLTVTMPQEEIPLILPLLTARADRATGCISGEAPPNALLEVCIASVDYIQGCRRVTATAAGTYTLSHPDLLSSGARGLLRYVNPQGHRITLGFGIRAWSVGLGERCAEGYADLPDLPFTATLQKADGPTQSITGTPSAYNAWFTACFSHPIGIGDRLTLTQMGGEMSFVVPRLTAHHDWAAQVLEGEAPPGSLVNVTFPKAWASLLRRTVADPTGRYQLDTRGLGLRVGDWGTVSVTDASGNRTRLNFVIRGHMLYLPVIFR